MEYGKQVILIEKTTEILGQKTAQMPFMHVIDGLVSKVESLEAEREQLLLKLYVDRLHPSPKDSPFVEQDKKARYMDIDD